MKAASMSGAAVLLLAGCVASIPTQVQPGQPGDEVMRRVGAPTQRYALPDGSSRLEYARGPYGLETWMIDLDAAGRVKQVRQVLTEAEFATVLPGQTRDEVLRHIGRPGTVQGAWQDRTLWYWRYDNVLCRLFSVTLESDGRVRDAGYATDPACEDDDFFVLSPRR